MFIDPWHKFVFTEEVRLKAMTEIFSAHLIFEYSMPNLKH